MTVRRSVTLATLLSLTVSGVCVGFPALGALASSRPAAVQSAATIPPNLDDFSGNKAYASFFKQKVAWSVKTCPKDAATRSLTGVARAPQECAKVKVPKDWNKPTSGSIVVGISRPAAQKPRARLLMSNPGGPGVPGLGFSVDVAEALGLMNTHQAIGVDARGTGISTQASCAPAKKTTVKVKDAEDPRTFTPAYYTAKINASVAAQQACANKKGSLLPYLNTLQTARDFNLVRHLLGYRKMDFVGTSYGTWLGTTLAKMFPHSVDRLILDANTDFASGKMSTIYGYQPESFQASIDRALLPWLARHDARFKLGATPAAVNANLEAVRAATSRRFFGPALTPMAFDESLATAAGEIGQRQHSVVPMLVLMAARLRENKPGPIDTLPPAASRKILSSATDTNSVLFSSVICNDTGSWGTVPQELARIASNAKKFPTVGPNHFGAPCIGKPSAGAIPASILARPVRQALMTQTEDDTNTLYRGGYHSRMRTSGTLRMVLLDDGHGHGAYTLPCVVAHAKNYLIKGVFPGQDVRCQAGPLLHDSVAYEFFSPSSPSQPLSTPFTYSTRDFSAPLPEGSAKPATRVEGGDEDVPTAREEEFRRQVFSQLNTGHSINPDDEE